MGKRLVCTIALFFSSVVQCEPTSDLLKIVNVRPYNSNGGSGAVYLQMDQNSVCATSVYKIDLSYGGAKEVYASILAAMAADKSVKIEVAGCNGWGSTIQSVYVIK